MLTVYLFHLTGYQSFFRYYINQSNQQVELRAEKGRYADAELETIKIKLNLPYLSDWTDYERCDGDVEINGSHYNCVKRKVSQDTLYLLCLPNEIKTQLYKTRMDYAAKANDFPAEKQNKNSTVKKTLIQEGRKVQPMQFSFISFDESKNTVSVSLCSGICKTYIPCIGQPPEFAC